MLSGLKITQWETKMPFKVCVTKGVNLHHITQHLVIPINNWFFFFNEDFYLFFSLVLTSSLVKHEPTFFGDNFFFLNEDAKETIVFLWNGYGLCSQMLIDGRNSLKLLFFTENCYLSHTYTVCNALKFYGSCLKMNWKFPLKCISRRNYKFPENHKCPLYVWATYGLCKQEVLEYILNGL